MRGLPIFMALLLASIAFADFELRSLDVTIDVKPDGSAHVLEKLELYMGNTESVELYETGLSINDLGTWKERIGLNDVRYHLDPAVVSISNIRIRPQPISRCIAVGDVRSQCFTTLIFDYDVSNLGTNATGRKGTGLFSLENFKPRTTRYVINRGALSFDTNKNGDIVIGKNTKLTITIPKDSTNIYIQPIPKDLEGSVQPPFKNIYSFSFDNVLLSKFEFTFQREETLDREVFSTFQSLQQSLMGALSGPQGLAVAAIAIVIILSFLYLTRVKKRKAE
jgi:hypothetical protein